MKIPRAPKGLKKFGRKFWREAHKERELSDSHDLKRLEMACRCLDEIDHDQDLVEVEGRFLKNRFDQSIENPAAKAIRDNKVLFCRIIRELGLDAPTPETRLPGRY